MKASRYCLYGKPFEDVEEGEGVGKKPLSIDQQVVTDEKGRRRFHGAFTGGFSAGYFNTVDTKEGWLPSSFKSTRGQRGQQKEQRPEQFMDSEDFSEFGIAPREIKTTVRYTDDSGFGQLGKSELQHRLAWDTSELLSEARALADMVKPTSHTFGVNLLIRMGWRPGRGIGSKTEKHRAAKPSSENLRFYGCALPPKLQAKCDDVKIPEEEEEEEASKANVSVSVDDVGAFMFEVKSNQHGLGYKPLQPSGVLTEDVLLKYTGIPGVKSSRGISGQAFGVGAFEDDDPDVYQTDDFSKFDFSSDLKAVTSGATVFKDTPSGEFVLAARKNTRRNEYPPPEVPPDFVPKGVERLSSSGSLPEQRPSRTPNERRLALSDGISVFDLLSTADRERLLRIKKRTEAGEAPTVEPNTDRRRNPSPRREHDFEAFPDDPAKQARFLRFIDYTRRERSMPCPSELGEEQWRSECTEFACLLPVDMRPSYEMAKRNSEPLVPPSLTVVSRYFAESLNSKFTRGSGGSANVENAEVDKEEAVRMKMFGMLTRESYQWYPEKQLCKRFNVRDPYPESKLVGVPLLQKKAKPTSKFESEAIPGAFIGRTRNQETPNMGIAHTTQPSPIRKITTATGPVAVSPIIEKETVEEVEEERPSADLFKAIFAASGSEADSEDEPPPSADVEEDIVSVLFTQVQPSLPQKVEKQIAFPIPEMVSVHKSPARSPTYGPPLPPDAGEFEESTWLLSKSRCLLEKTKAKKRHKKKHKRESDYRHGKSPKRRSASRSPRRSS
uniref:G-patch domain-containing protein n=1 Tax=Trichuris muris TaxID=70415 RepID=A0A5S6Q9R0_TRIMR